MTTTEEKKRNIGRRTTTSEEMMTKGRMQKTTGRKMIFTIETRIANRISRILITNTIIQDTIHPNHPKATIVDHHLITISRLMINRETSIIIVRTSNHKTSLITVTIKGENLIIQKPTTTSRNRIPRLLFQM